MKIQQLLKVAGAALLLSAGTWACKSLDENPDFANPGAFYKTEADFQAAVNGAYRPLAKEWFNTYYNRCVIDCALGIQTGYEKGPQYYKQGQYVATDEYINAFWAQLYDGVNRCNVVLDALSTVEDGAVSDAARTQFNGEMHFLRAMYYFQIWSYFQNIPVPDKPTRSLGEFVDNADGSNKALALMISDLTAAETELPSTSPESGRPNRWAAKTLLAKVLLEKGDNAAAKAKAEEVVNQSGLSLYADYSQVFDVAHENQGERLFEIQGDYDVSPDDNYNNMHAHFTPTDWDGGDPNTLGVGDGVTAAGWADAWIVGDNQWRADYFTDANDKRIKATFMDQYRSKNANDEVVTYDPTASSPFVAPGSAERKYKNVIFQKVIEYNTGGWQKTKKNYVILRLSDALLTHAEACARLNDNSGLATLNTVRSRAGLPDATSLTTDAVFAEWMREFAGDGWAFPTCRRFGKTAEIIQRYCGRTVDGNKYSVLPIPLVEITANPNVRQNAGWE